MKDNQPINITLLANEGILIRYKEIKILIDALHRNNNEMFSGLSEQVYNELIGGGNPLFENIDFIMFTHCHYDHFTAECTEAFLNMHRIKGLLMPDRQTREHCSLRERALLQAEKTWLLNLPLGFKKVIPLAEEVTLTVFSSVHAGELYKDVENFCYLLKFNGRNLFIIGDADYDADYFSEMLVGEDIEAAFVNPLFLNKHKGREVITRALKPEKLVVYHIPFGDSNDSGFRKLVPHDIKKHQSNLPPVYILWNELQEIIL